MSKLKRRNRAKKQHARRLAKKLKTEGVASVLDGLAQQLEDAGHLDLAEMIDRVTFMSTLPSK